MENAVHNKNVLDFSLQTSGAVGEMTFYIVGGEGPVTERMKRYHASGSFIGSSTTPCRHYGTQHYGIRHYGGWCRSIVTSDEVWK